MSKLKLHLKCLLDFIEDFMILGILFYCIVTMTYLVNEICLCTPRSLTVSFMFLGIIVAAGFFIYLFIAKVIQIAMFYIKVCKGK
mgnify:CR=1 FL=1